MTNREPTELTRAVEKAIRDAIETHALANFIPAQHINPHYLALDGVLNLQHITRAAIAECFRPSHLVEGLRQLPSGDARLAIFANFCLHCGVEQNLLSSRPCQCGNDE